MIFNHQLTCRWHYLTDLIPFFFGIKYDLFLLTNLDLLFGVYLALYCVLCPLAADCRFWQKIPPFLPSAAKVRKTLGASGWGRDIFSILLVIHFFVIWGAQQDPVVAFHSFDWGDPGSDIEIFNWQNFAILAKLLYNIAVLAKHFS